MDRLGPNEADINDDTDLTKTTISTASDSSGSKMIKDVQNKFVVLAGGSASTAGSKEDPPDEKQVEVDQCRTCLHRAVLGCLLPPEATEALASLDQIRRQLRKSRLRSSAGGGGGTL